MTRTDRYDDPDLDPAIYVESGNMPLWAEEDAAAYWDAADLYERANGRLYVSADFALPRDLPESDQVELARQFARELRKASGCRTRWPSTPDVTSTAASTIRTLT